MLPSIFGENLFDDMFRDFASFDPFSASDALYGKHARALMKTDIRETDNSYELDIDLPGFKKDELQLRLQDGYLTVSAAKGLDKDKKDKEGHYIRRERYAGQCSRSFYVGENITEEDVHAKFEDGILRLSIPKKDAPKLPERRVIAIE